MKDLERGNWPGKVKEAVKEINMRRIIAGAVFSLFTLAGYAQTFTYGEFNYMVDGARPGHCLVTGPSTLRGEAELPASVEYNGKILTVSGISDYAFSGAAELEGILIPETVTTIGRNAFSGCASLRTITLPDDVREILPQTFYGCSALEEAECEGAELIGASAFSGCVSLVEFPEFSLLRFIDDGAFRNCRSIREVKLEANVELGDGVFENCTSLASVSLPSGLDVLPSRTFSGCSALRTVNGTEKLKEIEDYAFYTCSQLAHFPFPQTLEVIGESAFALCSGLKTSEIKGNHLLIGDFAFTGCIALTEVEFSDVYELGREVFANAVGLEKISFDKTIHIIGESAFSRCPAIRIVECPPPVPPFMPHSAFDSEIYARASLLVWAPYELIYRQTAPWNLFHEIEPVEGLGVHDAKYGDTGFTCRTESRNLIVTGDSGRLGVYRGDGLEVCNLMKDPGEFILTLPSEGIYIISLNGFTKKITAR